MTALVKTVKMIASILIIMPSYKQLLLAARHLLIGHAEGEGLRMCQAGKASREALPGGRPSLLGHLPVLGTAVHS